MEPQFIVMWVWFGELTYERFSSREAADEKFDVLSKEIGNNVSSVSLVQELRHTR